MHVTKMVFLIFLCFLVCYLPITLVKIFDKNVKYPVIHVIGYILIYLSSCLNPVIYVTMNKQYRHAYLNTLLCNFTHSLDSTPSPMPHVSKSHNNMSVTFFKNAVNPTPKVWLVILLIYLRNLPWDQIDSVPFLCLVKTGNILQSSFIFFRYNSCKHSLTVGVDEIIRKEFEVTERIFKQINWCSISNKIYVWKKFIFYCRLLKMIPKQ